jgi:hypothetical protein
LKRRARLSPRSPSRFAGAPGSNSVHAPRHSTTARAGAALAGAAPFLRVPQFTRRTVHANGVPGGLGRRGSCPDRPGFARKPLRIFTETDCDLFPTECLCQFLPFCSEIPFGEPPRGLRKCPLLLVA